MSGDFIIMSASTAMVWHSRCLPFVCSLLLLCVPVQLPNGLPIWLHTAPNWLGAGPAQIMQMRLANDRNQPLRRLKARKPHLSWAKRPGKDPEEELNTSERRSAGFGSWDLALSPLEAQRAPGTPSGH